MPMVWDASTRNILLWTAIHHQTTSPLEIQKHWPHGGAERPSPRAVVEQWASIKKGCYDRGAVAFFTGEGGNASRRAPPRQQPAPARRNKNARPRLTGTQEVLDQGATSSDTARRPARARKCPASLSQVVLEISSDESDEGEDSDPKRVKANVHDVDRITNDRNKGGLKAVSGNPSLEMKVASVSVADPEAMLMNAVNGTLVSDSAVKAIIVSEPDDRSKESSSHVYGDGSCSRTTRHKQLCQQCQARKLAALTTERGERHRPQSSDGSFNFTFVGAQQDSSPHRLHTHRRSISKLGSFESQVLSGSTQGSTEESLTFSNGGLDMEESSDESLVFANGSLDRYGKRPMDRYITAMESPEACPSNKIMSRDLVVDGPEHIASARMLEDKLAIHPRMPTKRDGAPFSVMFGRNLPSNARSLVDEIFEKEELEPWELEICQYLDKEGASNSDM